MRSQLYKNARRAGMGEALARQVGDKPTFNAGVFALARTAPHWAAWRGRLGEALKRGRVFTSDQLALGDHRPRRRPARRADAGDLQLHGPVLDLQRRRDARWSSATCPTRRWGSCTWRATTPCAARMGITTDIATLDGRGAAEVAAPPGMGRLTTGS